MVGFWMSSKRPFEFVLGQAFFWGGWGRVHMGFMEWKFTKLIELGTSRGAPSGYSIYRGPGCNPNFSNS